MVMRMLRCRQEDSGSTTLSHPALPSINCKQASALGLMYKRTPLTCDRCCCRGWLRRLQLQVRIVQGVCPVPMLIGGDHQAHLIIANDDGVCKRWTAVGSRCNPALNTAAFTQRCSRALQHPSRRKWPRCIASTGSMRRLAGPAPRPHSLPNMHESGEHRCPGTASSGARGMQRACQDDG